MELALDSFRFNELGPNFSVLGDWNKKIQKSDLDE